MVTSPCPSLWDTDSSRDIAQEHASLQLSGKPSFALDDPPDEIYKLYVQNLKTNISTQ